MFQKTTLAPEITKLTLKGEKCEPIHSFTSSLQEV